MPELAPNKQLFKKYLTEWKGRAGDEWFEEYKKRFVEQLKEPEVKEKLRTLYKLVMHENKNIVLVCFCEDYRYCHRSIIGEYLESYGVPVEYN